MDYQSSARLAARRARFEREAANPAPKPKRTMAWAGGKITTNKDAALQKFLERKGDAMSDEQRAAVRAAQAHKAFAPPPNVLREAPGRKNPVVEPNCSLNAQKAAQKARKKLGEVAALEARLAAGEQLESNQLAKIARKAELLRLLV